MMQEKSSLDNRCVEKMYTDCRGMTESMNTYLYKFYDLKHFKMSHQNFSILCIKDVDLMAFP